MGGQQYTERVMVYLTKDQKKRLDREAYKRRKALTELVRDYVDTLPAR